VPQILAEREQGKLQGSTAHMFPGTFYLSEVDAAQRRFYART
jgi:hypothetical protein